MRHIQTAIATALLSSAASCYFTDHKHGAMILAGTLGAFLIGIVSEAVRDR
jgi:hypothetical protein